MKIAVPTTNPHGINDQLLAYVTEADPTTRYTAQVVNALTNQHLGTKVFEGSETFKIGLQGFITQSFSAQPAPTNTLAALDTGRAFAVVVKIGDVSSDALTVCCSKQNIALNTPISAREGITPMAHSDTVQIDVLTSLASSISAHVMLNPADGGEAARVDLCKKVTGDGILMVIVNGPKIGLKLAQSGKNFDQYSSAELIVEETVTNTEIAKHRFEIKKPVENSVRLCWRNKLGGIDYHTFPFLRQKVSNIDKSRAQTAQGGRIVSAVVEKQVVVCSEFLDTPTFNQVAEVVESPQVWIALPQGTFESVVITNPQVIWQPDREQRLELTAQYTTEESFII